MYKFGNRSKEVLATCHPEIQLLLNRVIQKMDFSVIEGIRTTETQQKYYADGKSQLDGINKLSWHQDRFGDGLSRAVDIVAFSDGRQQWNDERLYRKLAKYMFGEWQHLAVNGTITHRLEWGGMWGWLDMPHYQIKTL